MCLTILCIQMCDNPACAGLGCPIRRSPDQSLLGDSPRLIAACYVLHRLLKSRHPPCACVTTFHCCPRNFLPCEREPFGPSVADQAVFTRPAHRFTYSLVPASFPRIPRSRRKVASPNCQGEFLRKWKPSHTKVWHFSTKGFFKKKTLEKAFLRT